MDETRAALTDKVEALENRVVSTVESATAAVSETVAEVKSAVTDTVHSVTETVQETFDAPCKCSGGPGSSSAARR